MTISVIICTRNRPNELIRCLDSIVAQTHLPDEVLIIDGSDDDDQLCVLLKGQRFYALPIKYIHTEPGLTRQRNIGIDASQGDIVFFFDDDVVLEPEYLSHVMMVYEQDKDHTIGGAQGMDVGSIDSLSFLAHPKRLWFHRLFFLGHSDLTASLLPSGFATSLDVGSPEIHTSKKNIRVEVMSGAMISFRKTVLNKFRFDEQRYSNYSHGEDVDVSYRISRKYYLVFIASARAFHKQSPEHLSWFRTADFSRSQIRAQVRLFRKHCASNPLNYLAIAWSWLGLFIWHGIIHRNKVYLRGTLQGMMDVLREKKYAP